MKPVTFLAALFALAACDAQVETRKTEVPAVEQAATPAPAAALLTASGPAATLQPASDPALQEAASVVQLEMLTASSGPSIKLFGTAGGDPAMNGLYTYISFYMSPADGWRVFRLGDFLEYRVLSEAPGRVDLEVRESTMDGAVGAINDRTRRVIVSWADTSSGAVPATVAVTPAQ